MGQQIDRFSVTLGIAIMLKKETERKDQCFHYIVSCEDSTQGITQ